MSEKNPEKSRKNAEDEFVDDLPGGRFFQPASLILNLDELAGDYREWNSHDHMGDSIELLTMLPYAIAELRVARDLIEAQKKEKLEQDEYHSLCRKIIKESLDRDQQSDEHLEFSDLATDIKSIRCNCDKHEADSIGCQRERDNITREYTELMEAIFGLGYTMDHEAALKAARKIKSHADIGSLHT